MSTILPANVWSPEDLDELIADLVRYNQWLRSYLVKQHVVAGTTPVSPPQVSPAALSCLQALQQRQALTGPALDSLIADLQTVSKTAPRITFTLAGPPGGGLKKSLIGWCRQEIGPDILVNFQFNASILGGMVVRYGSHIYDWSFRRSILANQNRFAEILRNV